ncbi:MAG: hypothetical protein ACREPI_13000 [Candidatus Dormibacterales bacterium]
MDATLEAPAPQVTEVPPGPFVPPRVVAGAGVVVALLVVTLAGNWLWALDFFHVAGGALWTGIDLFMGFVIGPILGRLEVPARIAVVRRLMPMMLVVMPTLVLVTLTSGWQLARLVGNLTVAYPQRWWLVASYLVVGVMAIIAYAVLEPANIVVLLELRKPRPNGLVIGRVMRRFIYTAGVTGLMQVATLVIMTRIATW